MRIKVLIVDDNLGLLEMLKSLFINADFDVVTPTNGEDGFNEFLSHKPDCILSDIIMPHLNGVELAKKIFTHQNPVPLALMSGFSDNKKIDEISNSPYWIGFFPKPFDEEQLIEKLKNISLNFPLAI